jgi:hypothetical protein
MADGHGFLPDVDGEEANKLDANSRRGDDDDAAPPLWLASPAGRGCRKQESIDEQDQESHQHVVPVPGIRRRRSDTTPGERRATNIA